MQKPTDPFNAYLFTRAYALQGAPKLTWAKVPEARSI